MAAHEVDVPAELAPATAGIFVALHALNDPIAAYDAQLAELIERTLPEARRVKQVRGVGPVTALAFVLTLEDPSHFPDGRTASAYLGLVPRRDQSGAIDKQLRISKTGNNLLRRRLVQCAQYILGPLGHDCDLHGWGLGLIERGGKGTKKRAIVATARKLAVLMFRLWKHDDVWKPLYDADSHSSDTKSDPRETTVPRRRAAPPSRQPIDAEVRTKRTPTSVLHADHGHGAGRRRRNGRRRRQRRVLRRAGRLLDSARPASPTEKGGCLWSLHLDSGGRLVEAAPATPCPRPSTPPRR